MLDLFIVWCQMVNRCCEVKLGNVLHEAILSRWKNEKTDAFELKARWGVWVMLSTNPEIQISGCQKSGFPGFWVLGFPFRLLISDSGSQKSGFQKSRISESLIWDPWFQRIGFQNPDSGTRIPEPGIPEPRLQKARIPEPEFQKPRFQNQDSETAIGWLLHRWVGNNHCSGHYCSGGEDTAGPHVS